VVKFELEWKPLEVDELLRDLDWALEDCFSRWPEFQGCAAQVVSKDADYLEAAIAALVDIHLWACFHLQDASALGRFRGADLARHWYRC